MIKQLGWLGRLGPVSRTFTLKGRARNTATSSCRGNHGDNDNQHQRYPMCRAIAVDRLTMEKVTKSLSDDFSSV